jgi:S1-C subfamily serine protease
MTGRRPARRGNSRTVAFVLVLSTIVGACAGGGRTDATPPDPPVSGVPDDFGLPEELLGRVLASTVGISGVACGRLANGSGFAVTDELVVTNAHVILGIDEIRVAMFDGSERIGTPVAFDPVADLAILEVAGAALTPLAIETDTSVGTTGVLVGWEAGPFPDPTPFRIERRITVRIETVGGTERIERPAWLLAASVDLGDSGAALVNRSGEVIGVAFAASREVPDVGYAVRATAVDDLIARGLDPNLRIPDC